MKTANGLPCYEVHFGDGGALAGDDGLTAAVRTGHITDLFVLSHGWNNGVDSARDLYQAMFGLLADQLGGHRTTSAAVGVIWPSLLFPEDDPRATRAAPSSGAQLAAALTPAFPGRAAQLATMGELLDRRPPSADALTEFHRLAGELVTTAPQSSEDAGESALLTAHTARMLGHAAAMAPAPPDQTRGVGDLFSGLWSGAREVLRTLSYYEMKNRAGVVGQNGLGPLLATLSTPAGRRPRIHLMGHSFGARLVSYALAGLPDGMIGAASPVKSLTLIQAAFSHFAFATALPFDRSRQGGLAGHDDRVDGPLLATFTAADRAVGWWYPAASMLARQDSKDAADLVYRWGAMGHDGYQQEPAATALPLAEPGKPYDFAPGEFYALDANAVIKANQSNFSGAHSDVRHPEVLWAVVSAAGLGH